MTRRKELGEILKEADLVTDAQLAEALQMQRTFGERLASILVRQHILTEKFAVTYLGRQLGVPSVDLSKSEVDLGLLDAVPLELCERHLVFPIRVEGTRMPVHLQAREMIYLSYCLRKPGAAAAVAETARIETAAALSLFQQGLENAAP